MALAYVNSRSFVTATIIGSTTLAQLKQNMDSFELKLDSDVIEGIESIHAACPNVAP